MIFWSVTPALRAFSRYQLRLEAGAVMDLAGNALEEKEDERHFQVESGFDGTLTDYKPPQVLRAVVGSAT